jgi:hypothetical protein
VLLDLLLKGEVEVGRGRLWWQTVPTLANVTTVMWSYRAFFGGLDMDIAGAKV